MGLLSACERIELSVSQTPIPDQEFSYKTYQGIGNTCQATDGGLVTVLVGSGSNRPFGQYTSTSLSPYVERREVTVIKTDLQGQVQWTKSVWTSGSAYFDNSSKPLILPMSDGGYAVFLSFQEYKPDKRPLIIRLSNTGEVLSQQPLMDLQVTDAFAIQKVVALPDKGFIISARSWGSSPTLVLMRFDERAQLLWNRKYDQSIAYTYSMAATSDGGLLVAWSSYSSAISQYETYLLKTTMDGQQSWFKKYALFGTDPVVSEASDKGYVLLERGFSTSNTPANLILYKLDQEALIQWSKLYSPSISQYIPRGVFAAGDAYVALYSGYSSGMELLTTDLSGAEQNRQSINGPSSSDPNSGILRLSDGSFVYDSRSSQGQFLLTKTKPDKTLHWTVPIATNK